VVQSLATNRQDAMAVDGYRPSGAERISLELAGRSQPGRWDLTMRATLGGPAARARVQREGVRAGLADLVGAVTGDRPPAVAPADAWAALAAALAGQQAAATGVATRPATRPG
jgi:predicted dehydrogenase